MDGMAQFHIFMENCSIMNDQLHHKRRARSGQSLQRRRATREQYLRILIVCEGEKTEIFYFKDLCNFLFPPPPKPKEVIVEVKQGQLGNTPDKIIEYAKRQKIEGDFDKIYCVFDQDKFPQFYDAVRACDGKKIIAIPSIPCFEYWFILHFEESTKPFAATGKNSSGEEVIKYLEKHVPGYEKHAKGIFKKLQADDRADLRKAIERAKRVEIACKQNGTDNPSTKVHQLIEDLLELESRYKAKK